MKILITNIFLFSVLFFNPLTCFSLTLNGSDNVASLKSIKGFVVDLSGYDETTHLFGLTELQYIGAIRSWFHISGVKLNIKKGAKPSPEYPLVLLNVNAAKSAQSSTVAYTVELAVFQVVTRVDKRLPFILAEIPTYALSTTGYGPHGNVGRDVREIGQDLTRRFLKDYKKANGR